MSCTSYAIIAALLVASCGSTPQHAETPVATPHAVAHVAPAAKPSDLARVVLSRYLNATLSGHHAKAWTLLTPADQADIKLDAYVAQERANEHLRMNVAALGPTTFQIHALNVRDHSASAVVDMKSGLGDSKLRFVLHQNGSEWRVAYSQSWVTVDAGVAK